MAKIKKIVTEGDPFCEHCEHVRYCPYPAAADLRNGSGVEAEFIRETYKEPNEDIQVEVECKFQELQKIPWVDLDLPEIMEEHKGHKVSRFEDSEVYVYSKVKIDEVFFTDMVGFKNDKGEYYSPYPLGIFDNYTLTPASRIRSHICGVYDKNYDQWLEEHDDELRWCFEMMAQGREPEPFK